MTSTFYLRLRLLFTRTARASLGLVALVTCAIALSGCNSAAGGTPVSATNSYPKMGHAPDYSWVAGRVTVTRIQGGCVYLRTLEQPTPPAGATTGQTGVGTAEVSTAVRHDTSPPLRDMTPAPAARATPSLDSGMFVPGGPGWSRDKVKDGDYVVLFGHVARADEPVEMCPGGAAYIADSMQANP